MGYGERREEIKAKQKIKGKRVNDYEIVEHERKGKERRGE